MQEIYEEKGEVKLEDYEIVYQICDHPVLMTSPHYHNIIEIIYILEGEFVVTVSDTKYILGPGEMVLINSKEVHSVHVLDYGIHRSFAVKFLPETICSDSQSLMELKYVIPYIMSFSDFKTHYTKDEVEHSDIKNCIDSIMKEDRERGYAYKFAIRIYISHILLDLIRKVNTVNPIDEEIKEVIRKKFTDIFHYISNHYAEKLTAVQIAKKFGLRQSDFSANFKKITGKSFNEYLNYVRICKAKRMLISSENNISETAFSVGFANTSYFINCFKAQMGITPAGFKQIYTDPPASVYYNLEQRIEEQ
ncbi:MAG: AraC family transcriptional regulator [Clostridia bacterium]|nr:AraC family transcriptional regulator [Clostridia bacterium]